MKSLPQVDRQALIEFLTGLLNVPSPTGLTENAIQFTQAAFEAVPNVETRRTRKGALMVKLVGTHTDAPRALTAHVDTLGAMVKEIKPNGRLKINRIGGIPWNVIEGEGLTIFTRSGKPIRGSLLIETASIHVYADRVTSTERNENTLEVRLDEITRSSAETEALGIQIGDFIAFDPRIEVTNGFVRSRYLDDKASVACILAALHALHAAGYRPRQTVYVLISNYEEVGHGAATGFPAEVGELVAVDMAAVGEGQTSDEFHASLCVKDLGGPYDHRLSNHLLDLAEEYAIPYKVDIYPRYGSDGTALLHSGADIAVALIGPGVDASHNYERTHIDALLATTQWVMAYLLSD